MIKVLVVDDSAIVRNVLSTELSKCGDIDVIATAADPFIARDKIISLKPDVITLDLEMPRMDGLTFLGKLMKYFPMPVIIVSSLTPKGSDTAIQALAMGAVDVVGKPGSAYSVTDVSKTLAEKIRMAATARIAKSPVPTTSQTPQKRVLPVGQTLSRTTHSILAIGASTGGTRALEDMLKPLPADTPGTVIVQHMPQAFTKSFAARLNDSCAMEVREAVSGDPVVPGLVLLAPGGHHMTLKRSGARYSVLVKDGPPVHHQRPSVDVLFHSVARYAGENAIGVILTGMGGDGASGLLAMRQAGARTIAQDEQSCVVFGMPKEAIRLGGVEQILPLGSISNQVIELARAAASSRRGKLASA